MATKTINLTGAEVAVTGLDGAHAHITNMGADIIYAAKSAGISPGADGVVPIPAGNGNTLRGISGAVYLSGTGSVLIQSDDYVQPPSFRNSTASGGSGVDDIARAAVNEHAGNAEIHVTTAEKSSWNAKVDSEALNPFVHTIELGKNTTDTKTATGISGKTTIYRCVSWTDYPVDFPDAQGTLIAINYTGSGTAEIDAMYLKQIMISPVYERTFERTIRKLTVGEWKCISDGGKAASVGAYTEAKLAALEARIAALEGGTA